MVNKSQNKNIFKQNFTDDNIYTLVHTKGYNFDRNAFEQSMKSMFVGVQPEHVVGTWDKTFDGNASGLYTYSLDATKGNDRTKVSYRIRVYDSTTDQGIVLDEAFKRLEKIMDAKKDPLSDSAFDKFFRNGKGESPEYFYDKIILNLSISRLAHSTNFHVQSGTTKWENRKIKQQGWELSFKDIAVIIYTAYQINITPNFNIPKEKLELIRTAMLDGTLMKDMKEDGIDEKGKTLQDRIDHFFDKNGVTREQWKDNVNYSPIAILKKLSSVFVKINEKGFNTMSHKVSLSKSGLSLGVTMALNAFWGQTTPEIIKLGDTIKFHRIFAYPGAKSPWIKKSDINNKFKGFQIFA